MLNLSKQQKNEIFRIIEGKGLNPNLFSWGTHTVESFTGNTGITRGYTADSTEALFFRHEGKNFRFPFGCNEHGVYYSDLIPQLTPGRVAHSQNWNGLMQTFESWLDIIKYELEQPDLWKELPRGQMLMAVPPDYSRDENFSIEERRLVAEQLSKIEKFIVESNRSSGASAIKIQQAFIYLQQRTETASKLDWKNLFAGAILGLILDKAVDNGPEIMKLCNELLSPFFQQLLQLTHVS
jgi:hypothetical protein